LTQVYKIDDNNLKTLGFDVQEVIGIYDTPVRKEKTQISPILADGIIPFTGSNDIYRKEREIILKCFLIAANIQEAIDKLRALQTLLYTAGTRTLDISYSKYLYNVFCKDGAVVKRITGVTGSVIIYTVEIKLIEISNTEVIRDYDGNFYHTVIIGTQEWLLENLKTTHYRDGTPIVNLINNGDWSSEDGSPGHNGAYCWYDNDIAYKSIYGAIYNGYSVRNEHELAPQGCKIPENTDWMTLMNYVLNSEPYGGKLKETGIVHWLEPNTGANNITGFTGLPGGWRSNDGTFPENSIRKVGLWWSFDQQINPPYMSYMYLFYNNYDIGWTENTKLLGLSVRCLKEN